MGVGLLRTGKKDTSFRTRRLTIKCNMPRKRDLIINDFSDVVDEDHYSNVSVKAVFLTVTLFRNKTARHFRGYIENGANHHETLSAVTLV